MRLLLKVLCTTMIEWLLLHKKDAVNLIVFAVRQMTLFNFSYKISSEKNNSCSCKTSTRSFLQNIICKKKVFRPKKTVCFFKKCITILIRGLGEEINLKSDYIDFSYCKIH